MKNKFILPVFLVALMFVVVFSQLDFTTAQKELVEFDFTTSKIVNIKVNKKAEEVVKTLDIRQKGGEEVLYVANILDSKRIAISPISKTDEKCYISNIENYTIDNYDGVIYVENEDNLNKITRFLNEERSDKPIALYDGMMNTKKKANTSNVDMAKEESTSKSYTKTNTQEKNVDEADIVKTDGEYLYYSKDNKISIIKTTNGKMEEVSNIDFGASYKFISDMYLKDDKLIVVYTKNEPNNIYNIVNTGVTIYSLEDKKAPKLVGSTNLKGYVGETRIIGDNLYLVTNKNFKIEYIEEDKEPVVNTLKKQKIGAYRPRDFVLKSDGINLKKLIYFAQNPQTEITTITAFNIQNFTRKDNAYMGYQNKLYMSENNAYISYESYDKNTITNINRFLLDRGELKYAGSIKVDGYLLNQFSMSEINKNFFVAYTNDNANFVSSFDENLINVGKLENIAPGERIYSTRFANNTMYMVTFKHVDPLFAIDISNPASMKILGYIKMPGYSNYMHPIANDTILGIGQDTKVTKEGNVQNNGLKISLFSAKDPKNIQILDEKILGDQGSFSYVEDNHKALMDYKEKNLIGVPMQIFKNEKKRNKKGNEYYDSKVTFAGIAIYEIKDNKLNEYLNIENKTGEKSEDFYNDGVQRALAIGDYVYTFSNNSIKSTSLVTKKEVSTIKLQNQVDYMVQSR